MAKLKCSGLTWVQALKNVRHLPGHSIKDINNHSYLPHGDTIYQRVCNSRQWLEYELVSGRCPPKEGPFRIIPTQIPFFLTFQALKKVPPGTKCFVRNDKIGDIKVVKVGNRVHITFNELTIITKFNKHPIKVLQEIGYLILRLQNRSAGYKLEDLTTTKGIKIPEE
jgi:hypothetical protein